MEYKTVIQIVDREIAKVREVVQRRSDTGHPMKPETALVVATGAIKSALREEEWKKGFKES